MLPEVPRLVHKAPDRIITALDNAHLLEDRSPTAKLKVGAEGLLQENEDLKDK